MNDEELRTGRVKDINLKDMFVDLKNNEEDIRIARVQNISCLRDIVTALKYAKGEFPDNREERRRFIEKHQKYHNPHRTALLGEVGGILGGVSYLTFISKSPIILFSGALAVAAVTIYHVLKNINRENNFMKLRDLGREIRKSKLEMGMWDTSDIPYRQGLDYGAIDFG